MIMDRKTNLITAMANDGVIVVKNILAANQIQELKKEINKIKNILTEKLATMSRPISTYTDIAERQLGRLDYRCGFINDIFVSAEKPVNQIIRALSPYINFRYYWGAIPAASGAGPTNMHRDVYPILNTSEKNDLSHYDVNLPPYYFTVLIPLVEITHENGPTQFIKESHAKTNVDEITANLFAPLLSPGDIVIFDGRTLHQGLPNNSKEERLIAYITYIADWYHDQTFTINNYLLPELKVIENLLQ